MNKIILFSNIKGGVGKTTTSAHFAEYLTEKGLSAIAVDADLQASLSRHRERELEADPEQQTPWEIVKLNTLRLSWQPQRQQPIHPLFDGRPYCHPHVL